MTLENCKRLLAHYRAIGYKEAERDMLENLKRKGFVEDKPAKDKK